MSKDTSDPRPVERAPASDAEASLNEALSDLEHMLDGRRDEPKHHGPSDPATSQPGDHYAIPLLDDVVVPGGDATPSSSAQALLSDNAAFARVVDRLASEIEVIVHAEMETALERSSQKIRHQVRDHIEIMLPEILLEIAQADRRKRNE